MRRTLAQRLNDRVVSSYWLRKAPKRFIRWFLRWYNVFFPPMPDRFLPPVTRERKSDNFFEKYYRQIEEVQCGQSESTDPFQLSYFPITKNALWMANTIRRNLRTGTKTTIVSGNPQETEKLERQGYGEWAPWLWSRIPRGQLHYLGTGRDDEKLGWPLYFESINTPSEAAARESYSLYAKSVGRKEQEILKMSACATFVMRPNAYMKEIFEQRKRECEWPENESVLGMHIRRGDSATEDLSWTNRFALDLESYLAMADRFHRLYGVSTIYLSTESDVEIQRAIALRPNYRFIWQRYDRDFFPKPPLDIDKECMRDPSFIEMVTTTALTDLHLLSKSDFFIGTFNSEFSTLAWLLCIGDKSSVMPYANLSIRRFMSHKQGRLHGPRRPIMSKN